MAGQDNAPRGAGTLRRLDGAFGLWGPSLPGTCGAGPGCRRRRVQDQGDCFIGGALRCGQWVMRLSVIGSETRGADADRAGEAITAA